jgi:pyruvate/2-oxoglutarate/acetoin dehydrogenase E1 component
MNAYMKDIQNGMDLLASNKKVVFIGQAVEYIGTAIYHQVKNYPDYKKLEFPVAEDFQMGFCLGASMAGCIPVCIFPRMNFALCAVNQIFNHASKWEKMTGIRPHLIIKTMIGSKEPLDPGHQHKSDFTEAFKLLNEDCDMMIHTDPKTAYKIAIENPGIHMIIEHGDLIK